MITIRRATPISALERGAVFETEDRISAANAANLSVLRAG